MRDERDAAGPKARIVRRSWNFLAELGREFPRNRRNVDPDLFEDSPAQDRNRPATAARALPLGALEAGRRAWRSLAGQFVLDRLEFGTQSVAQFGEPRLRAGAAPGIGREFGGYVSHACGAAVRFGATLQRARSRRPSPR